MKLVFNLKRSYSFSLIQLIWRRFCLDRRGFPQGIGTRWSWTGTRVFLWFAPGDRNETLFLGYFGGFWLGPLRYYANEYETGNSIMVIEAWRHDQRDKRPCLSWLRQSEQMKIFLSLKNLYLATKHFYIAALWYMVGNSPGCDFPFWMYKLVFWVKL